MNNRSHALIFLIFLLANNSIAQLNLWEPKKIQKETTVELQNSYNDFRTFEVDEEHFSAALKKALDEKDALRNKKALRLNLPVGDSFEEFEIIHSSIMEAELQAKYPDIRTYLLKGIDDPYKNGRLSNTTKGLQFFITGLKGSYFIERIDKQKADSYVSYTLSDILPKGKFTCHVKDHHYVQSNHLEKNRSGSYGDELRTYKMAVSTTGEYSTYHGSTVSSSMAAIVDAVNRINVVYEKDMAIRFVLVNNNDLLINLNPDTDPFNGSNAEQMLNANPSFINGKIGAAAYDIGHVFATDGAGLASLGAVCRIDKAEGVTGIFPPEGNTFAIEYLAHEVGHQFGATHTFNNCSGNENSNTAYEPGSGSTIMSYAGLCGSNNVLQGASPYFHVVSLQQMDGYTIGSGGSCPDKTPNGNNAPSVVVQEGDFFVPFGTPFELTAEGSDPDGDQITYCWEQYDRGPRSTLGSPIGNGPSFRSFPPLASPTRIFPKLQSILDNSFNNTEVMSTGARNYNFQATVRDNNPEGGGAAWDIVTFKSSGSAGPFVVTSQNDSAEEWLTNNEATVTWDVAGTDGTEVNCQTVDIYLSKNLGFNFDVLLAEGVPNTGSATFIVPDGAESNFARVKVKAADNIFFNVNPQAFKVKTGMVSTRNLGQSELLKVIPNPIKNRFQIDISELNNGAAADFSLFDISGQKHLSKSLSSSKESIDVEHLSAGIYFIKIIIEDLVYTKRIILK